jgi:hypothetical protein
MVTHPIIRKKLEIDPKYRLVVPKGDGTGHWMPLPIDHPVYPLIGQISARWAHLEQALDFCIGTLADIQDPITSCITAQMMGHVPRCLTIKALAHWRGLPEIVKDTDILQNSLHDVSERRNRAIHDIFLVQESDGRLAKSHRMSKKELEHGLKDFDESDLRETISRIDVKINECHLLLLKIRDQVYLYVS